MEKQPTDNKAQATGARIDNSSGDGLDRDRAYDTGFKYQIPEAGQQDPPQYQAQSSSGADRPQSMRTSSGNRVQGGDMGERLGSGVRGVFAGIHGAGEWLRGGLGAAVDRTFGSEEGVTRNEAIAQAGQEQIRSGKFKDSGASRK
ncbi:uncharacterized protein BDV17DRAFT_295576 [Aspergillus undulatus]|uniref:uncharacterized protein n=1 Tax=Aspergillus undulatus TaxID=1810928 RepID=UPI003CCD8223